MPPTIRYAPNDWQEPLKLYGEMPMAHEFMQSQVITPPGYYDQPSLAGNILNNFVNITQQQKQRQQQQMQMQDMAKVVEGFAPRLRDMGYSDEQINNLFKVDPESLVKTSMEETKFASHQKSEIEKALELGKRKHEQEVKEAELTPDQLDLVDQYKHGKLSWRKLNEAIPSDKLDHAFKLSQEGLNLQKAAELRPVELDEKIQTLLTKVLNNKALPDKIKNELIRQDLQIKKDKQSLANSPTKLALEQDRQRLAERKENFHEKIQQHLLDLHQDKKTTSPLLKNGMTLENTKIFNTIAALHDGSLNETTNMYQAARKAGLQVSAPDALTDPKEYIKSIKFTLLNKSINDAQTPIQKIQGKLKQTQGEIAKEKDNISKLNKAAEALKNPNLTDAQALQIAKKSGATITLAGHKISIDDFQKYQSFDPAKKQRYIKWLQGQP